MKFTVDNLQLVNHAEIALDGVTVIAAPNGCGKSTISKGLASLASLSRDVSVNVQYRRFEKIIEAVRRMFSIRTAPISFVRWTWPLVGRSVNRIAIITEWKSVRVSTACGLIVLTGI